MIMTLAYKMALNSKRNPVVRVIGKCDISDKGLHKGYDVAIIPVIAS